jgi:hypothetical protein
MAQIPTAAAARAKMTKEIALHAADPAFLAGRVGS